MPAPVPAPACVALILAGRRGPVDTFADACGVSHRALVEIEGEPLLARVLRAVGGLSRCSRIAVSCDDPQVVALAAQRAAAPLPVVALESAASPAASVAACLAELPAGTPLLVTTADHPLLRTAWLEDFRAAAQAQDADVVAGLVEAASVTARFPETRRTWFRLGGQRFTGANLFWFRGDGAARAALFWTRIERARKQPWRMAAAFGPSALLRYATGRLGLEQAFELGSRAMGASVAPAVLPHAELAIDVDGPADLALAEALLTDRPRPPS